MWSYGCDACYTTLLIQTRMRGLGVVMSNSLNKCKVDTDGSFLMLSFGFRFTDSVIVPTIQWGGIAKSAKRVTAISLGLLLLDLE